MGFLSRLLGYKKICIQCHNNPDADTVAAAFGVYCYLKHHGADAFMVYGGAEKIKKSNLKLLLSDCDIPLTYTHSPEEFDLLLLIDCQRGQGNVEHFAAENIAIIDHHIQVVEPQENYCIKSDRQSCSTIIWELLLEEHFPLADYPKLSIALLYGLYTDTSSFADLFSRPDSDMRTALYDSQPLFEQLTKSNMTVAELMVASDAMQNHYFDVERRFAVVEALSCDQTVLGVIGDFMIQVDVVNLSFAYTRAGGGYRISIRSCREELPANDIAAFVCRGIGNGGGHAKKAGGYIQRDKLTQECGETPLFDVIFSRLCSYIDKDQSAK